MEKRTLKDGMTTPKSTHSSFTNSVARTSLYSSQRDVMKKHKFENRRIQIFVSVLFGSQDNSIHSYNLENRRKKEFREMYIEAIYYTQTRLFL